MQASERFSNCWRVTARLGNGYLTATRDTLAGMFVAKIVYDRTNCEGFWVCSAMDPDDFEEKREEKKVDLTGAREVSPGLWEKEIPDEGEQFDNAVSAAAGCPVDVIKVIDAEGKVVEGPETLPIEKEAAPGATQAKAEEAAEPAG